MNVVFKVYWNNPIGLTTESSSEQLQFNIPLGAIIADPSVATDLSNYYTKPQTDTQISTSVTLKADKTYVDTQDNLLQDQINLKANASAVNQSLGTKADLVDGKIPASQLPSFVDDVLEGTYINPTTFNNLNNQPYTPETDKIYIDTTTNKTYRWSGMLYVVISSGGGSSSPTWVNITTVGTIPAYVTNADIQVARFQGMLWIKGTFNVNTNVAFNSELFRITAQTYKPYAYSTAGTGRLLMLFNCVNLTTSNNKLIGFAALGNITNSTQALTVDVIFEAKTALATTDGTLNIVPTIISNLAY